MKRLVLLACLMVGFAFYSTAQIKTPAASPASKLEQTVGLSTVTVEYSRPSMKGRTIFAQDGLVPFGKMWRTGANAATKLTFSDDVKLGGKEVKAGAYAVITVPDAASWKVNLYEFGDRYWSAYREKDPTVSFMVTPTTTKATTETFTIEVNDVTSTTANITIRWENTAVNLPVEVEVDKKVMAAIESAMGGTTKGEYYTAATYYHDTGKDLNQALAWVQKATAGDDPKFWQVRREAMILADLGRYKEAIAAATKSKDLATKAENEDYIRMNTASIKEWTMKMGKKM